MGQQQIINIAPNLNNLFSLTVVIFCLESKRKNLDKGESEDHSNILIAAIISGDIYLDDIRYSKYMGCAITTRISAMYGFVTLARPRVHKYDSSITILIIIKFSLTMNIINHIVNRVLGIKLDIRSKMGLFFWLTSNNAMDE